MATLAQLTVRRQVVLAAVSALMILFSLLETHRFFENFSLYGHDWRGIVGYALNHQQPEGADRDW